MTGWMPRSTLGPLILPRVSLTGGHGGSGYRAIRRTCRIAFVRRVDTASRIAMATVATRNGAIQGASPLRVNVVIHRSQ